jgi:hypothetical protein
MIFRVNPKLVENLHKIRTVSDLLAYVRSETRVDTIRDFNTIKENGNEDKFHNVLINWTKHIGHDCVTNHSMQIVIPSCMRVAMEGISFEAALEKELDRILNNGGAEFDCAAFEFVQMLQTVDLEHLLTEAANSPQH